MSTKVPDKRSERLLRACRIALVLAILAAPIAAYVFTFGFTISNSHTRWSEFGSMLSGIYSPAIALFALLILIAQVRSQNQINTHQFDQSYIAEARSDLHYFLDHLSKALNSEVRDGVDVRRILHTAFQPADLSSLASPELLQVARTLNASHPEAFASWSALYPVLAGLKTTTRYPYTHNAIAAIQKISTVASFETCVCLDNYHWCLTQGRASVQYEFSKALTEKREV